MGCLRDAKDGRRESAAVGDHDGEGALRRGMVKMAGPEFVTQATLSSWRLGSIVAARAEKPTVIFAHHAVASADAFRPLIRRI